CHRRLEETLEMLRTPTRQSLDEALAFIDRAVRRHEDDEEQSLFPRLSRVPQLAGLLDRLTVQHRDQAAIVDELRAQLAAPAPDGERKCGAHQHQSVEKNEDEGGTVKSCVCDEGWDATGPAPPCKKAKAKKK